MKIVSFKGGLGNQIFEYFFYLHLKNNIKGNIYGYYNKKWLGDHNGLEIEKVFDVELPKATFFSNIVVFFIRSLNHLFKNGGWISQDDSERLNLKSVYFDGWWQKGELFFQNKTMINFRTKELDGNNKEVLEEINRTDSIALHVRRGDYLKDQFVQKYGGVCTLSYYEEAIGIINANYNNPKFFVFSDDVEWAKNNLELTDSIFIDFNKGENSFLDMYLMSHCKANIIANSSFSYWGAYLNKRSTKVIYPKKWFNSNEYLAPKIFKEEWIGI